VESARKRGQRHPHSGSANTKMRTRTKRRAGNTISRSLSKCSLNTSWCAAPRRAHVHVLTYQLESLALLVIWSTLSIQKEWIWRNMQRLADPLADLSQHFQSGPSRLALNTDDLVLGTATDEKFSTQKVSEYPDRLPKRSLTAANFEGERSDKNRKETRIEFCLYVS